MALQPVRVGTFPGLRLNDQGVPDIPGAIDLRNMEAPQRGILRRRQGHTIAATLGAEPTGVSLSLAGGEPGHVISAGAGGLVATAVDGGSEVVSSLTDSERPCFADIGQPGASKTFISSGAEVKSWDGSAFDTPTVALDEGGSGFTFPTPRAMAVTSWDNRLMTFGFNSATGGPNGLASSPSHVFFAEQGDPLTFSSIWSRIVTPGDGEELVAAVRWRDYIFAFKQSRFFVFYATELDASGNPNIKMFTVDSGVGALSPGGVVAGTDGVYFVSRRGVYRTTGEEVVPISTDLDPIFQGGEAPWFTGGVLGTSGLEEASLAMVGEKLVVSLPFDAGRRQLVTDLRFGGWGFWDLDASAVASVPINGQEQLWFGSGLTLQRQGEGIFFDDGEPFDAFWQEGWQTYDYPSEKTLRSTRVFGNGDMTIGYAADYGTVQNSQQISIGGDVDLWADGTDPDDLWGDGTDPEDTWGGGVTFDDGWVREGAGVRGTLLSTRIASTSGADFSVQYLQHHLADVRDAARDSKAAA